MKLVLATHASQQVALALLFQEELIVHWNSIHPTQFLLFWFAPNMASYLPNAIARWLVTTVLPSTKSERIYLSQNIPVSS